MEPKVWLVGEHNPYGSNPRHALFPHPDGSAGERLCCRVLGMRRVDYLRSFERRNLITDEMKVPRWSAVAARQSAQQILSSTGRYDVIIALGARVSAAFCRDWQLWEGAFLHRPGVGPGRQCIFLPHPSGRCREWNDPTSTARARELIVSVAPWLRGVVGAGDAAMIEGLAPTDCTTARPARCSNCGCVVEDEHCLDCGAP